MKMTLKTFFILITVFSSLSLICSFIVLSLSMSFMTTWSTPSTGGIETNHIVTFNKRVTFEEDAYFDLNSNIEKVNYLKGLIRMETLKSIANIEIDKFTEVLLDFFIRLTENVSIYSIRSTCVSISLSGNQTLIDLIEPLCNCFTPSTNNMTCVCNLLENTCESLDNVPLPICHDKDINIPFCLLQ